MPRAGLTQEVVIARAADLADEIGYDQLTLTALAARLGVAVPSLYKHVDGLDSLRRGVALAAIRELGEALCGSLAETASARADTPGRADRSRRGDVQLIAAAYRRYALEHPGRYAATIRAAPSGDHELAAASDAVLGPVLDILATFGLQGDARIHAARALRAGLHGFVSLEAAGGFGLPQDVDRSFEAMIGMLERGLRRYDALR
jgi:AcrR family transcriptional regulator